MALLLGGGGGGGDEWLNRRRVSGAEASLQPVSSKTVFMMFYGGLTTYSYVDVGRELRTSPSGIGNSSYELPEDLQGCDEAALPLSHTKLLVRGGT